MPIEHVNTTQVGSDSQKQALDAAVSAGQSTVGDLNDPAMSRINTAANNGDTRAFVNAIQSGQYDAFKGYISGVDFGGMDTANLDTFISALNTYKGKVEETISLFEPNADIDNAIKGDVNTAYHEFLAAEKALMLGYVKTLEVEISDLNKAANEIKSGHKQIAGSMSDDASDIRTAANNISVD